MKITLAHGSGGKDTSELINNIFASEFSNPILNKMEDSAVVDGCKKIAFTTDSFVVTPLFFKGGDIGTLAVCGTVNDLLMSGALPKYITSAFIIEEGADTETLKKIAASMAKAAREANVTIVAGDTKTVEGSGNIYINTAGVGFVDDKAEISAANMRCGDDIIVSGTLGDHHAAILTQRLEITNNITSDVAPLCEMVRALLDENIDVHTMRDITRGGLGTVLNELSAASGVKVEIYENELPVSPEVKAFCKILGLNVMHMGNEGKAVFAVSHSQSEKALEIIKRSAYGENAKIIGKVENGNGVVMHTALGGTRQLGVLVGEGLPRIC